MNVYSLGFYDFLRVVITTTLLVVTQVTLKLWMEDLSIARTSLFTDLIAQVFRWEFIVAGLAFVGSSVIWLRLLKQFEFSILYPMISISYIVGLFAAKYIFKETIPPIRWVGVIVIMLGVVLISRK